MSGSTLPGMVKVLYRATAILLITAVCYPLFLLLRAVGAHAAAERFSERIDDVVARL